MDSSNDKNSDVDSGDLSPDSERLIDELVDSFLDRLRTGETSNRQDLVDSHPELQPHLERRLRIVELILNTVGASGHERLPDETEIISGPMAPRRPTLKTFQTIARRIQCPHCGNKLMLIADQVDELTCDSCGSVVPVDAGRTRTDQRSRLPERIGRFKVIRMLGQGAFGQVLLGHDPTLDRYVALKIPRHGCFLTDDEEQRFRREARNVARLNHPNIVSVYEVADEEGVPFIVSEFVDGVTLGDLSNAGTLTFKQTATLMIQVAEAVGYAHQQGVIHRDLKPGNILIDGEQQAYVADFGLARLEDMEISVTLDGTVLGTPAYMSPEQAAGQHAQTDARSDVYSLGVILYRLLCRELPFHGTKRMLIQQVLHDEPKPPRKMNDQIPRDLETITLTGMAKEPGKRYQTAQEFADELRRWLLSEPIRARPISRTARLWRWCQRKPLTATLVSAVALLLVTVAAISVVWAIRENGLRQIASINATRAENRAIESLQRLEQLYLQNGINDLQANRLVDAAFWCAEASQLGTGDMRAHRIRLGMTFDQLPKLVRLWAIPGRAAAIEFTADGSTLVAGCADGSLHVFDLATGTTRFTHQQADRPIRDFSINASGSRLVTVSFDESVHLWNLQTNTRVATLRHDDQVLCAGFSHDGQLVATGGADTVVRIWNASDGSLVRSLDAGAWPVSHAVFVPGGELLVTFSELAGIAGYSGSVWNTSTGARVATGIRHDDFVTSIEFNSDSSVMLTGDLTGHVKTFQPDSGRQLDFAVQEDEWINRASFVDGDREIVTFARNGNINRWNAATGTRIDTGHRQAQGAGYAAVDNSEELLAHANYDGTVSVFWRQFALDTFCPLPNGSAIADLKFHPAEPWIAVAADHGIIQIWDLTGAVPDARIFEHDDEVMIARFSRDGTRLVTAGRDDSAQVHDVASGRTEGDSMQHEADILDCDVSLDGRFVATCGIDTTVRVWDGFTTRQIGRALEHDDPVWRLQFNPVKEQLACGTSTGDVRVWELSALNNATPEPLYRFEHDDSVRAVTHNREGTLLATASEDNTARIWNLNTGLPETGELQHDDDVMHCQFVPGKDTLVTCCADGFAYVWEIAAPATLRQKLPHDGPVTSVAIVSETGELVTTDRQGRVTSWVVAEGEYKLRLNMIDRRMSAVFSVDLDSRQQMVAACGGFTGAMSFRRSNGSVLLWDLPSGLPLSPPLQHLLPVRRTVFSPQDNAVATASADYSARLWKIKRDELPLDDLLRFYQLLAQTRFDDAGRPQRIEPSELVEEFESLQHRYPERFRCAEQEREQWTEYVQFLNKHARQKLDDTGDH